jgi:hypothetical protein
MKTNQRKKSKKNEKGYNLQSRRLMFSGGDSIRAIKFPIESIDEKLNNELKDAIANDYTALYGALNINDYENDGQIYSLFDFYLDCLRYGFRFGSSTAVTYERLCKISNTPQAVDEILDVAVKNLSAKFKINNDLINRKNIKTRLLTSARNIKTKDLLYKEFIGYFNFKKGDELPTEISLHIESYIKNIPDTVEGRFNHILDFLLIEKAVRGKLENDYSFSFFIDKDEIGDENLSIQKIVQKSVNKYGDSEYLSYLGLANNFNAFSNFLNEVIRNLQTDNYQYYIDKLSEINIHYYKKDHLAQIFKNLAEKSKKIKTIKLGNHYGDYRSDFGGKIASWASNFTRQSKAIIEDLNLKHKELEELLKLTEKQPSHEELSNLIKTNLEISNKYQIENFLFLKKDKNAKLTYEKELNNKSQILDIDDIEIYISNLAEIRSLANEYIQQESKYFRDEFPNLSDETPKIPSFIGNEKFKRYEKYLNSLLPLKQNYEYFYNELNRLKSFEIDNTDIEKETKLLIQKLYNLSTYIRNKNYQIQIKSIIINQVGEEAFNLVNKKQAFVFYRAKQSNANTKEITYSELKSYENTYKAALNSLIEFLNKNKLSLNTEFDIEKLLDQVEVFKITLSSLIDLSNEQHILNKKYFVNSEYAISYFKIKGYIEGRNLSKKEYATLLNRSLLSETRSLLNVLSRKTFISRYQIQTVNGEQQSLIYKTDSKKNFPLSNKYKDLIKNLNFDYIKDDINHFIDKIDTLEDKRYFLRFTPHKFGILIKKIRNENPTVKESIIKFQKSSDKSIFSYHKDATDINDLFFINSSVYQTQFLEWFLHKNTKPFEISMLGPFLTYEQEINVTIDIENNKITLDKANAGRLFTSIPFNLNYAKNIQKKQNFIFKAERKNGASYKLPQRFLGIDLGEYGFAYSIIEIPDESYKNLLSQKPNLSLLDEIKNIKILESNFIDVPELKIMRTGAKELKKKQGTGTFNVPSTYISRLREATTNIIRNKIHALALKYEAKIAYEDSISHFEQGGQKISKLYKTIKISDISAGKGTDADKNVMKIAWGDDTIKPAMEINSYATSKYSLNIRDSYLNYINEKTTGIIESIEEIEKIELEQKKYYSIYHLKIKLTDSHQILNLISTENYKINKIIDNKTLKILCEKSLRPSIAIISTKEKNHLKENLYALYKDIFETKKEDLNYRGNKALYRDVFNPNYFADADIQASINIALKGLVNEVIIQNNDESKGKYNKEEKEKIFKEFYKKILIK